MKYKTMTEKEMDAVCKELVTSSLAYQQGQVPMRETRFTQGKSLTAWYFVDGRVADLYTIILARLRSENMFTAMVLELPGCTGTGDAQVEALEHARQEVDAWLDAAVRKGKEIPAPSQRSWDY